MPGKHVEMTQEKKSTNAGKANPNLDKMSAGQPRKKAAYASLRRAKSKKETSAPGSLIGGIRSQGIRAVKPISTDVPVQHELTDEERKAKWQPPERDKAWFSGTNASRHKASSSYKVPSDYSEVVYDSGDHAASKPKANKEVRKKAGPKAKKTVEPKTGPLSRQEIAAIDNNYRIHGSDPQWKGWAKLLPGRSAGFILRQVPLLGLDKPDDKKWSKGEMAILRDNRGKLTPLSPEWSKLLPRKSSQAIARAYKWPSGSTSRSAVKTKPVTMEELGWTSGKPQRKKKTRGQKNNAQ